MSNVNAVRHILSSGWAKAPYGRRPETSLQEIEERRRAKRIAEIGGKLDRDGQARSPGQSVVNQINLSIERKES